MGEVVAIKRPSGLPASWTDEALFAAVRAHVFGGNVGAILSISDDEVRHWTTSYQWGMLTKLVMPQVKDVLASQMARIGAHALAKVDQRIEEGDPVINLDGSPKLDEDGRQVYRPLKAKDLADIATRVLAEQRALESKLGPIHDDEGRISLDKLARGLARYANATEIIGESA